MKTRPPSNLASLARAVLALLLGSLATAPGATLTGTYSTVARYSVVNLSSLGSLDWVHWGLYTEASLNRKAGVTPRIGDFATVVPAGNSNAFVFAYQYGDNYNGYSWSDGTPVATVTNTTTGVWAYGIPNLGTGFEFTVPADTTPRILKVYVGAYAGKGLFEASLSDKSATAYTNASLNNVGGSGPGGVYTLTYAAASAGQTLKIRWTLSIAYRPDGNVTLQAAALSSTNANNPPTVFLTAPTNNCKYAAPANLSLAASASDFDGTVSRVEFIANDVKIGEDTTSPYTLAWNGVAPGFYTLKAIATDNGGESSESMPVEVWVHGTGGSLTAGIATPPASVNLSSEGTADWTHWGLATNSLFNRKATSSPQLGDYKRIGDQPVLRYADNFTGYAWTDGTPTPSTNNAKTGVYIIGAGQGFALTLPADTTPRTAKVYCGLYGAQGNFQAWLSDFSAPAYTDQSLNGFFDNAYGVYTLTYTAASPGQILNIHYRAEQLYDGDYGNVTLQAVTLVGGGSTPVAVTLTNPRRVGGDFVFSFPTLTGASYAVLCSPSLAPANWQVLTNLVGTGSGITITNPVPAGAQRYYRVESK
jgi:hypothetical protein